MQRRFWLWVLGVVGLGGLLAGVLVRGVSVETDILALLPSAEQDPVVRKAMAVFSSQFQGKVIVIVGHRRLVQVRAAAKLLAKQLKASKAIKAAHLATPGTDIRTFLDFYFPYREALLPLNIRKLLERPGGAKLLMEQARRRLYQPMSGPLTARLAEDPMMLFASFVEALPRPTGRFSRDGEMLIARDQGHTYALLSVELNGSPFFSHCAASVASGLE